MAPDPDEIVELKLFTAADVRGMGRVTRCAGCQVELQTDLCLEPGAAVQIEWGDKLALGEVIGVLPKFGSFLCVFRLEHALGRDGVGLFWRTEEPRTKTLVEC